MNQATPRPQNELERIFREFLLTYKFSPEQERELFSKLEEAIVLNIINKLLDRLSEDDKKLLEQKNIKTAEELFSFFENSIPREDIEEVASKSVEEIMKKFLDTI